MLGVEIKLNTSSLAHRKQYNSATCHHHRRCRSRGRTFKFAAARSQGLLPRSSLSAAAFPSPITTWSAFGVRKPGTKAEARAAVKAEARVETRAVEEAMAATIQIPTVVSMPFSILEDISISIMIVMITILRPRQLQVPDHPPPHRLQQELPQARVAQ